MDAAWTGEELLASPFAPEFEQESPFTAAEAPVYPANLEFDSGESARPAAGTYVAGPWRFVVQVEGETIAFQASRRAPGGMQHELLASGHNGQQLLVSPEASSLESYGGGFGLETLAGLDLQAPPPAAPAAPPAPPSPPVTGPVVVTRLCCLLQRRVLVDDKTMGGHGSREPGVVYTGKAGFVDLAHLWAVADVTACAYQDIHAAKGASGTKVRAAEGEATLTSTAPPGEWLDLARSIADDDALGHEIWTYWDNSVGAHNSSFSPEDLCSNYLGTVVAARALLKGGSFVTEAEKELRVLLTSLNVRPAAEAANAFALKSGTWFSVSSLPGLPGGVAEAKNVGYLRRRNFTRTPWKTGHPSDAPTPAFVLQPFALTTTYTYRHAKGFTRADFPARIKAIEDDAKQPSRYGPLYNQP